MTQGRISRYGQFHLNSISPLVSEILDNKLWNMLVDVGCGDGSLLHALNQRGHLVNKSVYGIDINQDRLKIVQEIDSSLNCVIGSACELPISDKSVDIFVSNQVIEHVSDDEEMVREINRVLADDGIAYISTVFKKSYGWYFYRNAGKWVLDPTHLREYSHDRQLLDLFKKYSLNVLVNKKTLDGRPILDSVIRRIGGGRQFYRNRIFQALRAIKVPIPGYYIWEIVCQRITGGDK